MVFRTVASKLIVSPWIAQMDDECPANSEFGGWAIPLNHHLAEFFVVNAIGIYIFLWSLKKLSLRKTWKTINRKTKTNLQRSDYIILGTLLASYVVMFIHKYNDNQLWFLLQPCHCLHIMLMTTIIIGDGFTGTILFNIFLHLMFSAFLGLVAADLTCYEQPLELENWFIQHVLLNVLPLFYIYQKRYPILQGKLFYIMSFSIEIIFHFLIMLPAALYSGININYMLCPPSGQEATPIYSYLQYFGPYYRLVMIGFGAVFAFIFRYVFIAFFSFLLHQLSNMHASTTYREDVSITTIKDNQPEHSNINGTNGHSNGLNHDISATDESSADESSEHYQKLKQRKISNAALRSPATRSRTTRSTANGTNGVH